MNTPLLSSQPLWITILLFCSMCIPIFLLDRIVRKGTALANLSNPSIQMKTPRVLLFLGIYYFYVFLLSQTAYIHVNSLPPRILLFTAIPLLLFYFLVVFRSRQFWHILQHVSLSSLVRFHIFRFVGAFFLIAWHYHLLPKSFAFLAGVGDLIVASTAILVAYLIDRNYKHYKKITLIWNIIGFWDIVSVIVSAIYTTKEAIALNQKGIIEMAQFPYSLIPAFAPATIIFIHICIFKKLKMKEE